MPGALHSASTRLASAASAPACRSISSSSSVIAVARLASAVSTTVLAASGKSLIALVMSARLSTSRRRVRISLAKSSRAGSTVTGGVSTKVAVNSAITRASGQSWPGAPWPWRNGARAPGQGLQASRAQHIAHRAFVAATGFQPDPGDAALREPDHQPLVIRRLVFEPDLLASGMDCDVEEPLPAINARGLSQLW